MSFFGKFVNHCMQAFDAMIHFTFEGSFLYLSTFGRQVITSTGPFATLCKLRTTFLELKDVTNKTMVM